MQSRITRKLKPVVFCKEVYFRGMETFKPFELFQLVSLFAKKGVKDNKLFSHTEQKVIKMGIESLSNTDIFLILWTFAQKIGLAS